MTISEMTKAIHENAVAHGWWDEDRSFPEIIALIHSELSEALEEYRNGKPMHYYEGICAETNTKCVPDAQDECPENEHECGSYLQRVKPEGIAVELADAIIRILDWCGREGIDMEAVIAEKHAYNKVRSYRHGGKVI